MFFRKSLWGKNLNQLKKILKLKQSEDAIDN